MANFLPSAFGGKSRRASPLTKIQDEIWQTAAFGKDGELKRVLKRHPDDLRLSTQATRPATEAAPHETAYRETPDAECAVDDFETALRAAVEAGQGDNTEDIRDQLANTRRFLTKKQIRKISFGDLLNNEEGDYSIFYIAICKRHDANTRYLLHNFRIDLGFRCNVLGSTPFLSAVRAGRLDIVQEILTFSSMGPSQYINIPDLLGHTPLHELIWRSQQSYDEPRQSDNEPTVESNELGILRELLSHGANINALNNALQTPLHLLTREKQKGKRMDLINSLLDAGAEVNTKDRWGNSPLHDACTNRDHEVIEKLIENGAELGSLNMDWETPKDLLSKPAPITHHEHKFIEKFFLGLEKVANGRKKGGNTTDNKVRSSRRSKDLCGQFRVYLRLQWPRLRPSPNGSNSVSWVPPDLKVSDVLYPKEEGDYMGQIEEQRPPLLNFESKFQKLVLEALEEEGNASQQEEPKVAGTDEPEERGEQQTEASISEKTWKWISFPSNNMTWIKHFIIENFRNMDGTPADSDTWGFFQANIHLHETNDSSLRVTKDSSPLMQELQQKKYKTSGPPEENSSSVSWRNAKIFIKPGSKVSMVIPFLDIEEEFSQQSGRYSKKTPQRMLEKLEQAYSPLDGMDGVQPSQTLDETLNSTEVGREDRLLLRSKEYQVIYRWSLKGDYGEEQIDMTEAASGTEQGLNAGKAERVRQGTLCKWLMVRQLWLWKLDENTILTTIPFRKGDSAADNLLETMSQGKLDKLQNLNDLIRHLVHETVTFPSKFKWAGLGEHVLDIFENELASLIDKETSLTWDFAKLATFEGMDRLKKLALSKDGPEVRIQRAAVCTWLARDIRDEARLLLQLFEQQLEIVIQVAEAFWPLEVPGQPSLSAGDRKALRKSFIRDSGLDTLIQRVKKLEKEASATINGFTTIMQVMQAQASLREAQSARLMNVIIVPLTVVTVVFAPLSFLTSLFAVNNTAFPHNNEGELRLGPSWIAWRMVVGEVACVVAAAFMAWAMYHWEPKSAGQKSIEERHRRASIRRERSSNQNESDGSLFYRD